LDDAPPYSLYNAERNTSAILRQLYDSSNVAGEIAMLPQARYTKLSGTSRQFDGYRNLHAKMYASTHAADL